MNKDQGVNEEVQIKVYLEENIPTDLTITKGMSCEEVLRSLLHKDPRTNKLVLNDGSKIEQLLEASQSPWAAIQDKIKMGLDEEDVYFLIRVEDDDDQRSDDEASLSEESCAQSTISRSEQSTISRSARDSLFSNSLDNGIRFAPGPAPSNKQSTPTSRKNTALGSGSISFPGSKPLPTSPYHANTLPLPNAPMRHGHWQPLPATPTRVGTQMEVIFSSRLLDDLTIGDLPIYGAKSMKGGQYLPKEHKDKYPLDNKLLHEPINCLGCQGTLRRPLVSKCGHVLCEDCVYSKFKRAPKHCPTCYVRVSKTDYRQCYYLQQMLQLLRAQNDESMLEPTYFRALHDYEAAGDNQLSFKEGQLFLLKARNNNGWFEVELSNTHKSTKKQRDHGCGKYVPSNFIEELSVEPYKNVEALAATNQKEANLGAAVTKRHKEAGVFTRAMQIVNMVHDRCNDKADEGEFVKYFSQHDFYPDATPSGEKEKKHERLSAIHEIVKEKLKELDFLLEHIDYDPGTLQKYPKFLATNIRYCVRWNKKTLETVVKTSEKKPKKEKSPKPAREAPNIPNDPNQVPSAPLPPKPQPKGRSSTISPP